MKLTKRLGLAEGKETLALLSCIFYGLSGVREGLFERLFDVKGGVEVEMEVAGVSRDGSIGITVRLQWSVLGYHAPSTIGHKNP